jgi:formylglycine-generating enzyme required for sulfatase activity
MNEIKLRNFFGGYSFFCVLWFSRNSDDLEGKKEFFPGDVEGPQRTVTIQAPFAVGRFAVTFDEWDACVAGRGATVTGRMITVGGREAQSEIHGLPAAAPLDAQREACEAYIKSEADDLTSLIRLSYLAPGSDDVLVDVVGI